MININKILLKVKAAVIQKEPKAKIILFGSRARKNFHKESDIDLLILLDRKITHQEEKELKSPLYDIEFESGVIISPIIHSKKDWEGKFKITPLYQDIKKEGIKL